MNYFLDNNNIINRPLKKNIINRTSLGIKPLWIGLIRLFKWCIILITSTFEVILSITNTFEIILSIIFAKANRPKKKLKTKEHQSILGIEIIRVAIIFGSIVPDWKAEETNLWTCKETIFQNVFKKISWNPFGKGSIYEFIDKRADLTSLKTWVKAKRVVKISADMRKVRELDASKTSWSRLEISS